MKLDKFEHNMRCNMLSVYLTHRHIEENNLPKFQAIDYSQKIIGELKNMPVREFNKFYKDSGSPTNLLLWEGWNYEPKKQVRELSTI